MKSPAVWHTYAARFDAMSSRERVLVGTAILAAVIVLWDTGLMQPLTRARTALLAQLAQAPANNEASNVVPRDDASAAPADFDALLERVYNDQRQLQLVDKQLADNAAGLIAPERTAVVLQDVLHGQHGLTLVSLKNKAVQSLQTNNDSGSQPPQNNGEPRTQPAAASGPYLHSVEIIVEGSYADILGYLHALQALPSRVYWVSLEIKTLNYPLNRARIEVATLSLDKSWVSIGATGVASP